MTNPTTHGHPSTRTELLENMAAGAYYAWSVGTEHAGPDEALRYFVDEVDDETVVRYMRTAVLIAKIAGAEIYWAVWPPGDDTDDAADIAREYLRAQL